MTEVCINIKEFGCMVNGNNFTARRSTVQRWISMRIDPRYTSTTRRCLQEVDSHTLINVLNYERVDHFPNTSVTSGNRNKLLNKLWWILCKKYFNEKNVWHRYVDNTFIIRPHQEENKLLRSYMNSRPSTPLLSNAKVTWPKYSRRNKNLVSWVTKANSVICKNVITHGIRTIYHLD